MNLQRLHHFAWKCANIEETTDFYCRVLGLKRTHLIEKDHVPSTGEYAPYKHVFFEMPDKSSIAFFDMGDGKGTTTDSDDWIVHFAFKTHGEEELLYSKAILEREGVEVIGPTDHGFIRSIYFFDPNGLRLEITYDIT